MRTLLLIVLSLGLGAAAPSAIEHVVEPGESLWSIAARPDVYGDPYLWPVIYKFNRDQIQSPSRIYPRQRLVIPIRLDAEAREAARLEAGAPSPPDVGARGPADVGAPARAEAGASARP